MACRSSTAWSSPRWAGTPLAPLLAEAGLLGQAKEVVFWGADAGDPDLLLCYEMNGQPLPAKHGAPPRLIAPRWYVVANVKWLSRIEVRDTRLMNKFMARDYVTLRAEPAATPGGGPVWTKSSVGRALLKSAPAFVACTPAGAPPGGAQYRVVGTAWGAPIERVEAQLDGGSWLPATIDRSDPGDEGAFAWRLWTLDWPSRGAGEHAVSSRARSRPTEGCNRRRATHG